MIRTVIWFVYFWIDFLINIPNLYYAKKLKKDNKDDELEIYLNKISKKWSNNLLKLAGIKVKIIGMENIPENENVLFVSNHQSNFDIPILLGSLNRRVAFIAKEEIKKMPFIGGWMEIQNCVFIKRDDPRQSVRAINKGAKFIGNGQAMVIFPEGTRSADGSLNEFKAGSFKLPVKSKAKIVPITINGSINSMKRGSLIIKPAEVVLTISKPIEIEENERDTSLMRDFVVAEINKNLRGE
ncbi:lysophospholipid acyltransferase family protein [Clostridiaceae bacterium HSG29]|nr:lysophospholipid acyltransferase family protein [Clostridiaceae bacterium HSG29]